MKIGILTFPLLTNYGGLLQAYALQETLKRNGHEAFIVRLGASNNFFMCQIRKIKSFIFRYVLKKDLFYIYPNQQKTISAKTHLFVDSFIVPKTDKVTSRSDLKVLDNKMLFDAYVVGSDQIWRAPYNPKFLYQYYLDFIERDGVIRMSYAASFGTDQNEYTKEQLSICSNLIKKFTAVSVRESSGVDFCKNYLSYNQAVHVLDPTMLLNKEDYIEIIDKMKPEKSAGNLFYYILDWNDEYQSVLDYLERNYNFHPFKTMPQREINKANLDYHINECVFPCVSQWLRSFLDADLVLTDSFHGTVFSIIFNKPFYVLSNKARGLSRIYSLLNMFGLENRLLTNLKTVNLDDSISWDKVNAKREEFKKFSLNFLFNHLNK